MADLKPTPTQDENDRTRQGEHVIDHEYDGSAFQGSGSTTPAPVLDFLSPSSGVLPEAVGVQVNGENFTDDSAVLFDGMPALTNFVSSTVIRATFSSSTAGDYPVIVRSPAGDSSTATFTFTDTRAAGGEHHSAPDETHRGRRRR